MLFNKDIIIIKDVITIIKLHMLQFNFMVLG